MKTTQFFAALDAFGLLGGVCAAQAGTLEFTLQEYVGSNFETVEMWDQINMTSLSSQYGPNGGNTKVTAEMDKTYAAPFNTGSYATYFKLIYFGEDIYTAETPSGIDMVPLLNQPFFTGSPTAQTFTPSVVTLFGATLTITAVPEPSTWAMTTLGFASLGFASYRVTRKGTAVGV